MWIMQALQILYLKNIFQILSWVFNTMKVSKALILEVNNKEKQQLKIKYITMHREVETFPPWIENWVILALLIQ